MYLLDVVSFSVPGPAGVYRERARIHTDAEGKNKIWSNKTKSTSTHQAKIALAAREAMGNKPPLRQPLKVELRFFFEPAYSWPKWKLDLLKEGRIAHTQRPDFCNLRKLALDAMTGIVFHDDSYICADSERSGKFFDPIPRTEITVSQLDMYPMQMRSKPLPGARPAMVQVPLELFGDLS